ncbi:MAG: aldehyde ferredoxin oxidoreductase family protein [Candidatus Bathyarchaeia archaeon]
MAEEMHAYAGKILRVDLSNGKITTEPTMNYAERFLGGRGINQWILFKEVKPGIWPLDPANRLIFGAGVLAATPAPAACRNTVDSKNVLTGGVGSANCGGHFAPELKFAGYDHIVVQGRSREPCFLWIDDDHVKIREAKHLWGKTTWETDDAIRKDLGDEDIQVASIGPAGENLTRAACIISNGERAAGKCGLGAVMGSKNLKAVAVRGSGKISVAKPEEFMRLVEEMLEKVKNNKVMKKYRRLGPTYFPERDNKVSGNTVRNFQDGFWEPEKFQKTRSKILKEQYFQRGLACFGCPVACSHYLKVTEGEFRGVEGEGYKANTLKNFGPKLDIDYLPAIIKIHVLCSQYGLDVDIVAGVIAWAMECYQRGILTKRDTDGLRLEWGNYRAVLELMKKIAFRDGFGDLLAEGCKRASEIVGRGSEKYAIHIKGQDLYEPLRTAMGWALGTIVSPRGGGHLRGAPACEFTEISPEDGEKFFGVPTAGNRKTYEGKAKLVAWFESFKAVVDSLGLCYFLTQWTDPYLLNPGDLAELFSAATGKNITVSRLLEIGERIHNVEKAFNVREGMTRRDDYPPERFFEPIKSGPGKGQRLHRENYEKMLSDYYVLRGWDAGTGLPTKAKLEELGLLDVVEELGKIGKLGESTC